MADKTANVQLDPYTAHAEAEANTLTPQQKIDGLKHIVKQCKHGMLVTRSKEDVRTLLTAVSSFPNYPFSTFTLVQCILLLVRTSPPIFGLHTFLIQSQSQPSTDDDLHFLFIGNNASYKFDEIKANDRLSSSLPFHSSPPHTATGVNVSFIDVNTTNWASISGVAKVHNDKDLIERLWSPMCVTTSFSLPFPLLHTYSGHPQHFGLLLRPWRWRPQR